MDRLNVLGTIEIGLIGRQHGEHAAHDGDGCDGGGAESGQINRGHRSIRIRHHLGDAVRERREDRDSAQGEDVESSAPPDAVRDSGPSQPTCQITSGHSLWTVASMSLNASLVSALSYHQVAGGEGSCDEGRN